MNVNRDHRVNTMESVSILRDRLRVIVLKDSRDPDAKQMSMNASHIHVRMMEAAWTIQALSDAFACQDSPELNAKSILMSALQLHASMEDSASIRLTVSSVIVQMGLRGQGAKSI